MITLYQRTDCPFCWKVRLALAELDLEYDIVETRLGEKHPEVLRLSPTGSVPVLLDGGLAIWESAVILEYLDSRYAPGRLMSSDPLAQASIRLLQAYSDKVVGSCLRELVFEKRSKPEAEWKMEIIRSGLEGWMTCMDYLEEQLGTKTYFGDRYSAADCALAPRFGVAAAYGAEATKDFPGLRRWYASVTARPGWKAAYPSSFIRTQ
ncbi:glutathione S-transferase family protein [Pseudomonadota bacterium]